MSELLFGTGVTAFSAGGQVEQVQLSCIRHADAPPRPKHPTPEDLYEFRLVGGPFGKMTTRESSTWQALSVLREHLENQGWYLAIAAARRDYYPIHWTRNPEATSVADYRHNSSPTIGFLSAAEPKEVGTVAEQEDNYRQWLDKGEKVSQ